MRLLVAVTGDEVWIPGQVVDVDEETAAKWCDGERAARVPDDWLTSEEAQAMEEKRRQESLGAEKAVQRPAGERPKKAAGARSRGAEKAVQPPAGERR